MKCAENGEVSDRIRTNFSTFHERKRRPPGRLTGDCCQVDVGEYTLLSVGSEPSHRMSHKSASGYAVEFAGAVSMAETVYEINV